MVVDIADWVPGWRFFRSKPVFYVSIWKSVSLLLLLVASTATTGSQERGA